MEFKSMAGLHCQLGGKCIGRGTDAPVIHNRDNASRNEPIHKQCASILL